MTAEETKAFLHNWVEQVWNQGNNELIDRYVAPEYTLTSPGAPPAHGPADFRHFRDMWRTALPDFYMTIEDVLVEGDRATWRVTAGGTQRGELFGIPPTNRHGETSTIIMSRFAGGQWVEDFVLIDMLGLLQQLGVVPMPGAVPA